MFTCKSKKRVIIGYLDASRRIVAAERYYILQNKSDVTKKWYSWQYYSNLADLLRSYTRMLMHRSDPEQQDQGKYIIQLLDRLLALEQKIEAVGNKLESEWTKLRTGNAKLPEPQEPAATA